MVPTDPLSREWPWPHPRVLLKFYHLGREGVVELCGDTHCDGKCGYLGGFPPETPYGLRKVKGSMVACGPVLSSHRFKTWGGEVFLLEPWLEKELNPRQWW